MLTHRAKVRRVLRTLAVASGLAAAVSGLVVGCATGVEFETDDPTTTSGGPVGSGGGGGGPSLCATDCSSIMTPPCLKSVCNEGLFMGTVGECVVVPDEGATCDDGMFCTIDDTCDATGVCTGGPPNECGMTPGQCKAISCDEDNDSCSEIGAMDGAPCQNPTNLCLKGSSCAGGQCSGGTIDDCFFFPTTNDCHVAECDPADGMCHEEIGNEGGPCTDTSDLCTIDKTCVTGVCQGGQPKNCSGLTMGCVLGVCDTTTGQCVTQNLMNGDPCDDLNFCTTGELCTNGQCINGTPVTACMNGDGCCPTGCNATNDIECAIPMGTVRKVDGTFLNVQYHKCAGQGTPGQCTATAAQQTCQGAGLKVVSHASDGTSTVFSLGATMSCSYSVSYYTANQNMPSGSCLVAIANLMWFDCCTLNSWHGNTLNFAPGSQTFGYVAAGESGYVSTNPNVSGSMWGCNNLNQAASNITGCSTQYVACVP